MQEIVNYVVGKNVQLASQDFNEKNITPQKSIFLEYLRNSVIEKDSNFICMIEGKSGSGKSICGLGILERWSKYIGMPFDVKTNVVFDTKKMMYLLSELENKKKNGENIKGFPILFDEAGISMDNRQWHDHVHKIINDTAEVFRYLNLVLFITTPSRSRVDVKLRDLAHATLQPKHIKKNEYALCKFYLNERSWNNKQELFLRLNASHKGWRFVIDFLKVKKPSAKVFNEYQEVMKNFKGNIIQVGYSKLNKREDMSGGGEKKPLTLRQRQIYMLSQGGNPNKSIAVQLGISEMSVSLHLRNIRAKGYNI